ncbi:MAG: DUF3800 domain-containing protein [Metallibacterium scheffleri]|jgi:hypothetical protein|uniref:DUF3800 domain-containing protein n=1 Tax=Metallibacterium scheffleri TaxID=993689 RepID=UPI0026F232E2|nr:DUF3800 domain-containing protein [Metallibacterium scheffleri]MCK9367856.1 DUF3800 domain-containing protein [Metallibacterium scheffleri]
MTASFVAYVDESGDEGFKFLANEQGSSRWFVLSALVIRKENDLQVVQLARQAREILKKDAKKALHFRELRHEQRVPLARLIGGASVRTVHVLVHKPSIREPEVFQQQAYALYRYATRLLVERVSWLCRDNFRTGQGDGTVEMVFSNRSAMSYDALRGYLQKLKAAEAGADVRVDWRVVDPQCIRAVNHDQLAGLQLADAVASGVFFAVHRNPYGEFEDRYLRLLAKTIYRNKGRTDGYGLKLWCNDAAEVARVLQAADDGRPAS